MGDNFTGRILDKRYEIQKPLGQGSTGTVFAAHDTSALDRQVAVKVVKTEHALPPDAVSAFIEEVRRIAKLDHPHILRIYDLGTETVDHVQVPYLVMQLARGGTLTDQLAAGMLSLDEAEHILKEICAGLDYAHSQEVLHLDLKPDNILFDEQGHVMVADFGLTGLIQEMTHLKAAPDMTTQGYASPEQLSGGRAGLSSDVYTLGILLYQMLTGELPKREQSNEGLLVHLERPLPPGIRLIIERATQPDPHQRYHTAGELAQAFTAAMASQETPPAGKRARGRRSSVGALAGHWKEILAAVGLIAASVSCVATVIMVPEVRHMLGLEPSPTPSVPLAASQAPTSTPTPTLTPPPTTTPTAAPSPGPCVVVSVERSPIYAGPGVVYDVLGQAQEGDRLPVLGRSEDGVWFQIDYLGWSGWVAAQSVTADADASALPTVEAPPTLANRSPAIEELGIASTTIEAWTAMSVTCAASDPDGDELTYVWAASDGFITGEGDSVTYNAPEVAGSQMVTVTVQDKYGREAKRSIQVQIAPAHPPPGAFEPVGVFARIWQQNPETRRKLGWATAEESVTRGAQQSFERGLMFWRRDRYEIYVLAQGGNWQVYLDTWEEGMDEYSCPDVIQSQTPPTPIRGFGKVWCEKLGGPNAEIGCATNHEQGYEAHWQIFEHGWMCQGLDGAIYVLYEDRSWQSYPYPSSGGSSNCPGAPPQRVRVGDSARVCTAYHQLLQSNYREDWT